ncbi:MAG: outer membrane protein assembly factor BamC [Kangiellaceae bacterium]|nr:outer membrane protein assembly factor BamC [Kangiellaceae bacterium]
MLKHNKQKLRNTLNLSLVVTAALSVSACSWFSANDGSEDIDDRYMQSQQGPDLQLPPNTTELKVEDQYRVPEGVVITERDAQGKMLNLEPPQLLLIGGDGVREDKEQAQPTVWVRNSGSQMMDYINRFVQQQNIALSNSSAQAIETDWISDEDESAVSQYLGSYNIEGQRHRFALKVIAESQAAVGGTSEVGLQAVHLANQQEIDGQWAEVQTSDRVAKQFLNYFLGFYDSERTKEARARILQEGAIDVRLGNDNQGNVALVTDRDFQSVWQQMPRVLESLNLPITDRDQSAGTYYFNVKDPDSGVWDALFGDDDEAKVNLQPGDYQIKVKELNTNGVAMTFFDSEGNLLPANKITEIYPEFSAAFRSRANR